MIESKTFTRTDFANASANGVKLQYVKKIGKPNIVNFQPQKSACRFSTRGTAIRLFLTCWLVFTVHFATNTVREIYPALSFGDHLSFDVSEYAGLHPDIFTIEERGAFINNNPGASIMGAIPYTLMRPVTDRIIGKIQQTRRANPQTESVKFDTIYPMAQEFYQKSKEKGFDVKFGFAAAEMQALVMSPLSALSVVVMFWVLSALTKNQKASIWLSLLYAFATPVFYRTAQLNQNLLVAHFTFFAFVLLRRFWSKEKKPFYFLAGLCAGWTVVLDYSGLVAVAVLSGYALSRWLSFPKTKREVFDLAKFAAGAAIGTAVLMFYQYSSFGNPIFPAQSYMPPANFTEIGYRGFSFPQFDLLFETAFSSSYGLFTSAPLLLSAFFAPVWLRKKSRLLEGRELVFMVVFTGLFFIFCAANQYGRMQFNSGVRHIVPVVPFVFLLAANVLLKLPRIVAVLIGIFATYWSWCLAMYRDVEQGFGVFEAVKHITLEGFRLPWLTTLERMGYVQNASAIPIFLLCACIICAFWFTGKQPQKLNFDS